MKIGDRIVSITNDYGMKGLYIGYGYNGALNLHRLIGIL